MKPPVIALVAVLLASCASPQAQQNAAGLATVSAMAVALPLIPVAKSYLAIVGDSGKDRRDALRARLDPVYEARTVMIDQRDPLRDVKTILQSGIKALLPSVPDGIVFPGLEKPGYDFSAFAHNAEVVNRVELLAYLQTLMAKDPADNPQENGGLTYMGPTALRFQEATWRYKTAFNQAMYRALQNL